MHFRPSTFGTLLEPINRRHFKTLVARHDADAYDKSFSSLDHLIILVFAQLSGAGSLRSLAARWNARSQHHYHLGSGRLARSTLSDANRRRPPALFADTFATLAGELDSASRRDGHALVRLIDSTPVPLGTLHGWAQWNGRIRGMKLHIVHDPAADCPRVLGITAATVNDAQIGRTVAIEPGATYVFDKGYCHYQWWTALDAAGAHFVTRPKCHMRLAVVAPRPLTGRQGDGFTVLADDEVRFASKGDSRLPVRLRRLRVQRHHGGVLTLLTNDLQRPAVAIAALYKQRWQIELLFRWIKQHLRIRSFLGRSDNAVRLQLFAAMIAYALLRIAARTHRSPLPILRFADLVAQCLLDRRSLATIDKPPPVNPHQRIRPPPNQLAFAYA